MAGVNYTCNIIHKNGTRSMGIDVTSVTLQNVFDAINGENQFVTNPTGPTGTGNEIGLSLTDGGTPLDLTQTYHLAIGQDSTLYALYADSTETITGFYLDGTEYKFEGGGTVVSGDSGTIYTIKVSSSEPSSGTSSNIITFVTA